MSTRIPTTAAECRGKISLENVGVAVVKLGALDVAQKGVVQKARFSGNTGAAIPPSRLRDFRFGTMEWRQAC